MNKRYYMFISIISIFVIWLLFSLRIDNPIILPNPFVVLKMMVEILTDSDSLLIIFHSLVRLAISLSIAFVLGIVFGLLGGLNDKFDMMFRPIITTVRTLPVASIIIVILIWFGYQKSPFIITVLVVMPVIYEAVVSGINSIDSDYKDVIEIYAKGHPSLIKDVYIPMISPFILASVIQSLGLGFKVLVMAEMLSQTTNSIGYVLYLEKLNLNIDKLFAWTLILVIIVSIIEYVVRYQNRRINE